MILLVSTPSLHAFPRTSVLDGWVSSTACQMGGGAPDKLRGRSAEAVAKLGQSFAERNDVDLSEAVMLMAAV